jgi:hypothetical protein
MEAFLNFLWVLIAAVALGFWRARWHREGRESRRDPLREWTAIGCALVLLFFAVSLTDDLHSEVILFDECSTSRRCAVCVHHSSNAGDTSHSAGLAVSPRVATFRVFSQTALTVPEESVPETNTPRDAAFGRAPPSSSL